jgi:hypothetical protein
MNIDDKIYKYPHNVKFISNPRHSSVVSLTRSADYGDNAGEKNDPQITQITQIKGLAGKIVSW